MQSGGPARPLEGAFGPKLEDACKLAQTVGQNPFTNGNKWQPACDPSAAKSPFHCTSAMAPAGEARLAEAAGAAGWDVLRGCPGIFYSQEWGTSRRSWKYNGIGRPLKERPQKGNYLLHIYSLRGHGSLARLRMWAA